MFDSIFARLLWLERQIVSILAQLAAILARLAADEQQLAQLASQIGFNQGGALIPAELTASLLAGSIGTPATAAGTLLVPSGSGYTTSGGQSITISSTFATAITVSGSKFCWLTFQQGTYWLVSCDC